jgi:hypothetical protein
MVVTPQMRKQLALMAVAILAVAGGFSLLLHGGQERQQRSWDTPMYHRDPRAPKVCMCLWMRSAFRVPCEDIPPELLKE